MVELATFEALVAVVAVDTVADKILVLGLYLKLESVKRLPPVELPKNAIYSLAFTVPLVAVIALAVVALVAVPERLVTLRVLVLGLNNKLLLSTNKPPPLEPAKNGTYLLAFELFVVALTALAVVAVEAFPLKVAVKTFVLGLYLKLESVKRSPPPD